MSKRLIALSILVLSSPVLAATTFLHHFDGTPGNGAGDADFAAGNPAQISPPPFGNGGQIVSSPARFGNSLLRTNGIDVGGRIQYTTANNYNVNVGTIEMWINQPDITASGFVGLWGTVTGSGNTDVRMYIYDTGAGRTFGAYQLGGGGTFWEIEQAIPEALLTSNTWHHVAWAFDTNAGITATWWDGQLLRNTPDAGVVNPRTNFTNTRFQVGENQNGSAPFPGYIDELRISDTIVYDTTRNFIPPTAPFTVGPAFVLGDFNFDGGVDASDIDPFVVAANEGDPFAAFITSSQPAFAALYPGQSLSPEIINQIGDMNGDGGVDASDVDPFVVFANSGGTVSAIPEPAALSLLSPALLLLKRRRSV